ncbi:hypothetical protein LCGC14_2720320, partial [marine sediment metagenome]
TASVIFTNATDTFTFTQASTQAAKMLFGDMTLYETTAGITKGVTFKSPGSLADAYTLTMPAALPSDDTGSNLLVMTAAGVLATTNSPVLTTPQINDTSKDHQYVFAVSELEADRTVTLPLLTGNDTFIFAAFAATLTKKSVDLANNTLTGTLAEFNTALSDATFVSLTGSENLTNKTLTAPVLSGSVTGTYTLGGTPTIASPAITGVASFADGSAAAPSLTNTGDLDTGIFFPAANAVGIAAFGVETLRSTVATNLTDSVINSYGTLDASDASTASVVLAGGLAVAKKAHFGHDVTIENTVPRLIFIDTNQPLDEGDWEFVLLPDGSFNLRALFEAGGAGGIAFSVTRTGTVIDAINFFGNVRLAAILSGTPVAHTLYKASSGVGFDFALDASSAVPALRPILDAAQGGIAAGAAEVVALVCCQHDRATT